MTDRHPMTTREIFRRIMRFEKPDRTPLWQVESIADRAIMRWRQEGSLKPDQSPYELIPYDGNIVTVPLNDQPPIPGFKEETLEEMLPRLLLDPPAEFGVMPFWFLNDELDEQEICRQLADFADHGVGGVVLHPRIGLPRSLAWMSERLLAFYEVAIREAAKRGLRVVLYDEGMYPSGSSAGQVVAENPAYACRCFLQRPLDGDAPPQLAAGENLVAIVARRDGTRLAVVDQPSGSFIRGLHFKRDMDSEWKAGAVPDSEGDFPPAADLLNPAAVACFIRLVYDRFAARFSRYFGSTVMAIFTDEPYAMSKGGLRNAVPGTTGFLSEVNRLLGYDFTPHLPALWFDDEPDAQIHRRRYQDAVRQRFEETYYRPLHAWCEKHGLPLTGHPHEPDDYDALRFFHMPGQDLVLRRVLPDHPSALEGRESTQAKCSSSAMLHAGRRRNANEYCGAYGHELTWDEMNWLANWCLVRGVNLLYPHAFYYSVRGPRREERPPDVGPNSPWWARYREHADACRRLCWLNTDSRHVCHVAILGADGNLPWGAAKVCFEHQHDFNYLSERELADGVQVDADGLHLAGMIYSALIVENEPSAACQPKLRELERLGRAVRYSGSGADALIAALDRLAPRTVSVWPAAPGLRARHVCKEGWHAFILFNECSTPLDTAVELPMAGDCLSFDPATGRRASRRADRPLRMDGHETTVLLIQGVEQ